MPLPDLIFLLLNGRVLAALAALPLLFIFFPLLLPSSQPSQHKLHVTTRPRKHRTVSDVPRHAPVKGSERASAFLCTLALTLPPARCHNFIGRRATFPSPIHMVRALSYTASPPRHELMLFGFTLHCRRPSAPPPQRRRPGAPAALSPASAPSGATGRHLLHLLLEPPAHPTTNSQA